MTLLIIFEALLILAMLVFAAGLIRVIKRDDARIKELEEKQKQK